MDILAFSHPLLDVALPRCKCTPDLGWGTGEKREEKIVLNKSCNNNNNNNKIHDNGNNIFYMSHTKIHRKDISLNNLKKLRSIWIKEPSKVRDIIKSIK